MIDENKEYPGLTEDAMERIADTHWAGGGNGVVFLDIQQHNACNHTLSGTIDVDGVIYGFIIDSGDWNGTVVHAWGDPEEVGIAEPAEPPEPRTFVPQNRALRLERPGLWKVYLSWRLSEEFKDKVRGYNYDRHFQPGGQIESYYAEWAAKRGMKTGLLSNLTTEEQRDIAEQDRRTLKAAHGTR